jgi:hypothetical protein
MALESRDEGMCYVLVNRIFVAVLIKDIATDFVKFCFDIQGWTQKAGAKCNTHYDSSKKDSFHNQVLWFN